MSREVLNRPSSARLKELDRQLVEVNPHHYLWYVAVEISLPSQPALLTYRVTADGAVLTCEPLDELPLAQSMYLF